MNPKKVLIVDDNAVLVRGLSNVLSEAGYEVLSAEDGAGAVSTVRREKPDLVLLDISYPPDVAHGGGVAWDGFLIMNWLSRMPEAVKLPVIIITASEAAKYKDRAMKAGAVAYLEKPVEPEQLLTVVREFIGDPPAPAETTTESIAAEPDTTATAG